MGTNPGFAVDLKAMALKTIDLSHQRTPSD